MCVMQNILLNTFKWVIFLSFSVHFVCAEALQHYVLDQNSMLNCYERTCMNGYLHVCALSVLSSI